MLSDGGKGFSSNLTPKFEGPFRVMEKRSPVVFLLETGDSRKNNKVYLRDLKRFVLSRSNREVAS